MTSFLTLLLVRMAARVCGIPCEHVVEIVPRVLLAALPDAPPGVLGVLNLRGRVVPVLDVRGRYSDGHGPPPPYQQIVIVGSGARLVGAVVDEVTDVLDVAAESIERPGELAGVRLPGVVRIGDDLVLVLGPDDFAAAGHANHASHT